MERRTALKVIGFTMLSSILSSCCGAVSKKSGLDGKDINLCYAAINILFALFTFIIDTKKTRFDEELTMKLIKSLTNGFIFYGIYTFFFFRSFDLIPYGDMYAIIYSVIFLTTLTIEKLKLKEKPSFLTLIAIICSLSGLVLFSQPESFLESVQGSRVKTLWGVTFAGLSGLGQSLFYTNLQYLKSTPISFHWLAYALGSAAASAVNLIFISGNLSRCDFSPKVIAITACLIWPIASLNSIIGSQLSLPSIMFSLRLVTIVFGYSMQLFLLHEETNLFSVMGASAICIGVLTQVLSLYVQTRKKPPIT